jgi:diguanylate cyclase (GGDEF)-like protein
MDSGTLLLAGSGQGEMAGIRESLEPAGFRLLTAQDGWEAIKHLSETPVDAVIAALSPAEMAGSGMREKILLNPSTRHIPVLHIADEVDRSRLRATLHDMDSVLTRPFNPIVLAMRVQAILEQKRVREEIIRIDPLTRLLNETAMTGMMQQELSRIERYGRHGTLVLAEVDNFSTVNTESGFAMGDMLLTWFAGVILSSIRSMDLAARSPGNQFLVFLPETGSAGAEVFFERLRKELAGIADAITGYALTFSAGMAAVRPGGTQYDAVLGRARESLEQARALGGGRHVIWREETPPPGGNMPDIQTPPVYPKYSI